MRFFWSLFAVLLLCCPGCSTTPVPRDSEVRQWRDLPPVSGYLLEDTVWRDRVLLAGDLLIPPDRTLTIRAGTTVFVRPSQSTKIEPEWLSAHTELQVRGALIIEGTSAQPVYFIPTEEPSSDEALWSGFLFDRGARGHISHAVLRFAEAGATLVDASVTIEDCRFERCRYGAVFQGESRPLVRANHFVRGEAGVFCWRGATPSLEDNVIAHNEEEGLFFDSASRPRLSGNLIRGNGIGVVSPDVQLADDEVILQDNILARRILYDQVERP